MNMIKQVLLVTVLGSCSVSTQAADIAAGKAKSAVCAACHGAKGVSVIPTYPNLAGQKELYLIKQIKAFRDGQRVDMQMKPLVAGLSDKDIENISAYYASLDPSGK